MSTHRGIMRSAAGAAIALALVAAACGAEPGASGSEGVPGTDCPITIPNGFTPPAPYPETPSVPGQVWYGAPDLWTLLPTDGSYAPRKSVWWSANFPGGAEEEVPAITVTYVRLDGDDPSVHEHSPGTNAYTVEDGWFMIAGIDPEQPGCWEVTAEYEDATLSYVYERS